MFPVFFPAVILIHFSRVLCGPPSQSTRRALSYPITSSSPVKDVQDQKVRPTDSWETKRNTIYLHRRSFKDLSFILGPPATLVLPWTSTVSLSLLLQMYIELFPGESTSASDAVEMHASFKQEKKPWFRTIIKSRDSKTSLCLFRCFALNGFFSTAGTQKYLYKFIFLFKQFVLER